jgi:hypothetical protein
LLAPETRRGSVVAAGGDTGIGEVTVGGAVGGEVVVGGGETGGEGGEGIVTDQPMSSNKDQSSVVKGAVRVPSGRSRFIRAGMPLTETLFNSLLPQVTGTGPP